MKNWLMILGAAVAAHGLYQIAYTIYASVANDFDFFVWGSLLFGVGLLVAGVIIARISYASRGKEVSSEEVSPLRKEVDAAHYVSEEEYARTGRAAVFGRKEEDKNQTK